MSMIDWLLDGDPAIRWQVLRDLGNGVMSQPLSQARPGAYRFIGTATGRHPAGLALRADPQGGAGAVG